MKIYQVMVHSSGSTFGGWSVEKTFLTREAAEEYIEKEEPKFDPYIREEEVTE